MNARSAVRFLSSILLLVVLVACSAYADSRSRIVRLSYVEGTVEIDQRDGRGFGKAFVNMPVQEQYRVWARGDAWAELEFEDGSTVRLTPDTAITLQTLRLRGDGNYLTQVLLDDGTAYFDVARTPGDFTVAVQNREIRPEKNSRFRVTIDREDAQLAVRKGKALMFDRTGNVEVRKNETLTLTSQDDRYYLAKGYSEGRYDEWDNERREYRERYVAARSNSHDYGYAYGVADLNYYGQWIDVPGYGPVWRPSVAYGWTPYSNGAWVYYPGYGQVWVSSYAWGWAPYRYGSWVYVSNYGWCWNRRHSGGWGGWLGYTPTQKIINNNVVNVTVVQPPVNNNNVVVVGGNGNHNPRPAPGDDYGNGTRGRRDITTITQLNQDNYPTRSARVLANAAVTTAGAPAPAGSSTRTGATATSPVITLPSDSRPTRGRHVYTNEDVERSRPAAETRATRDNGSRDSRSMSTAPAVSQPSQPAASGDSPATASRDNRPTRGNRDESPMPSRKSQDDGVDGARGSVFDRPSRVQVPSTAAPVTPSQPSTSTPPPRSSDYDRSSRGSDRSPSPTPAPSRAPSPSPSMDRPTRTYTPPPAAAPAPRSAPSSPSPAPSAPRMSAPQSAPASAPHVDRSSRRGRGE